MKCLERRHTNGAPRQPCLHRIWCQPAAAQPTNACAAPAERSPPTQAPPQRRACLNCPVAGHQCTLFTILGRTRVQRVTMPCRLTSLDRYCGQAMQKGTGQHGESSRGTGSKGAGGRQHRAGMPAWAGCRRGERGSGDVDADGGGVQAGCARMHTRCFSFLQAPAPCCSVLACHSKVNACSARAGDRPETTTPLLGAPQRSGCGGTPCWARTRRSARRAPAASPPAAAGAGTGQDRRGMQVPVGDLARRAAALHAAKGRSQYKVRAPTRFRPFTPQIQRQHPPWGTGCG